MRIITYILILLIVLCGMLFATLNSQSVTVDFYITQTNLPLSLMLVLFFTFGALLGLLVGFLLVVRAKMQNYRLKQRLNLCEREIANLRAIPIQDNV